MISQGQTFRLHLQHVDDLTVAVDVRIGDEDRVVGSLHGQLPIADLVPAARALTSLLGGAAAVLRSSTGSTSGKERIEKLRRKHPNAYATWTAEDDRRLVQLYEANVGIVELARRFGRQPSAIRARLEKVTTPGDRLGEIAGSAPADTPTY